MSQNTKILKKPLTNQEINLRNEKLTSPKVETIIPNDLDLDCRVFVSPNLKSVRVMEHEFTNYLCICPEVTNICDCMDQDCDEYYMSFNRGRRSHRNRYQTLNNKIITLLEKLQTPRLISELSNVELDTHQPKLLGYSKADYSKSHILRSREICEKLEIEEQVMGALTKFKVKGSPIRLYMTKFGNKFKLELIDAYHLLATKEREHFEDLEYNQFDISELIQK